MAVAAIAAFVAAVVFDRREGLVVALFLASVIVVAIIFVRVTRARVGVTRRPPSDLLAVGEDADVVLDLRTDSWDPSITRWRDSIPPSFGAAPEGLAERVTESSVSGIARASYTIRPRRRGEFTLGPLVVTREDPFGLAEAERASIGSSAVIVTPRVFPLVGSNLVQASGEGARHEHRMSNHPRVDELIARAYRSGDPMRRIHWRATARRGELMVRQEEQEVDPAAVLLLDTAVSGDGVALVGDDVFEHMVDLAASIAVHSLDGGFRLTLVESTPRDAATAERFEPSQGSDVLRRLALVSPNRPDREAPDIAVVSRDVLDRVGAPVPFIVILSDVAVPVARRLASLARLADPAIAFVPADPVHADGAHVLRAAGWIVGVVDTGRSVPEIWNDTMLVERGSPAGVV